MNILSAPQAASCDFLLGLEFNNPVRVPLRDLPIVTRDPSTGLPSGLELSVKGVSGVVYDMSGRVVEFSMAGVNHTVDYSADSITVNGARQVFAALDPSGRIAAVT